MNQVTLEHQSPLRRHRRGLASGACALALLAIPLNPAAQAATWYLHAHQPASDSWNTLADWFSDPLTGSTHPTSISAADEFDLNGYNVRTVAINTGSTTFGGGALVLRGGAGGVVGGKVAPAASFTIPKLVSYGGTISNWHSGIVPLTITTFENNAHTLINPDASNRGFNVTVGTLYGNGDLTFIGLGAGSMLLNAASAQKFYGTLYVANGCQFTFQNAIVSSGALDISGVNTKVTTNFAVTFSALRINGADYAAGTYSAASLGWLGTGSITVLPARTWYLQANQGLADNWHTLADWFSATTGGTNPTGISANDEFSTNTKQMRTLGSTGPVEFGGAAVLLNGGSILVKSLGTAAATTAIRNLIVSSGSISNGSGGTQIILLPDLFINGATTFATSASNRGFDLGIGRLSGAGNVTFTGSNGGPIILRPKDAYPFEGGLIFSGTSTSVVTFATDFMTSGVLNIGAGNVVNLNANLTVAGLTTAGTVRAAGSYTAAALGYAGSGTITVKNRPQHLAGVNLPGAEFSGATIYPTTPVEWDYYAAKGLKLIRVPFLWQRVQSPINTPLLEAAMVNFDTVMSLARNRGMKVMLDMHNYDQINGSLIDTPAEYAAYQDVWTRIAARYANETALWGYDIMNEPHGTGGTWPTAAQYGVNGVRASDMNHFVVVEGDNWAGSQGWMASNANLDVSDPAGKLIYQAHSYWDRRFEDAAAVNYKFDGNYGTYEQEGGYPNMGIDLAAPFVHWLRLRKAWGIIGEFGVPMNVASPDPGWGVMLDNFLQYARDNGVSTTYWSGGGGWTPTYPLLCAVGKPPVDAASMAALQSHVTTPPSTIAAYQAETIATSTNSTGDTVSVFTDSKAEGGSGEVLAANAAADYVAYTLPSVPAGTYTILIRAKTATNRGIFQLSIDGVNQGAATDQYSATTTYPEFNLGTKTFSTTANHVFTLTVTGKNAASTDFDLTVDYIKLVK